MFQQMPHVDFGQVTMFLMPLPCRKPMLSCRNKIDLTGLFPQIKA
jgi:hypothetical protein